MILSIEKLNNILLSLLGNKELVNLWWTTPNKAFNLKKPLDVYIDNPDKVTKYLLDQIDPPFS